ncbi:carotenoid oxygenase family protein [Amycolatopsis sp. FDAARGOS 1241]|uniref:carotenoid oxygenase family protein n=1 Tax=Amycolatopsis sp. FDAARGOS 1241 TaxID=2778070 RepID=UPI00194DB4A0|nr:carotenoid oxygenase family protein [Amycolatopsis sp. FDAARGOS 1241]QRP48295.1 carotenoid oxygenase family protein [Amycolatopsis sp. FDAARGOS 1241]
MPNQFLEDNFAPVTREHTATRLEVTGHLPDHLDGRYLRNGPNPLAADEDTYHWFLGDGMVHGVRLRDGRAEWYRNRWIRTPHVAGLLGEAPEAPNTGIGANTNVIGHAGRTLALIEGGLPAFELTEELDTVGQCDFDGTLPGGYTAHPKRDPRTGELHAVSYHFGAGNRVQYSVIGTDGRARRVLDIEVTGAPMMHDFSLTENHVVFYDLPVTFDPHQTPAHVDVPDPLTARTGRGVSSLPYRWNEDYPARVGVMPREGGNGDVRWFDVEPCYVFHPLNAYDDGDRVVLDVVRHSRVFDRALHGPAEGVPTLDRWTVDLAAGKVLEERLDDHGQEFPRVDERLVGRAHRYGYAVAADGESRLTGALHKHDLHKGSLERHTFGPGRVPGEFVFVPSGVDAAEDDGVLMGFVFDAATQRSDLTLLDAATLETVAAVHLPGRVPHGFHGNWVPVG